jgi:hypothetical protein
MSSSSLIQNTTSVFLCFRICIRVETQVLRILWLKGRLSLSCNLTQAFSPVSVGVPVKCGYCDEYASTSAALCSRRRLRRLSTLNLFHSLAAMLACCLIDCYLLSVPVVARTNAVIGERAGWARLLDLQRWSARGRCVFSADQRRIPMAWHAWRIISL